VILNPRRTAMEDRRQAVQIDRRGTLEMKLVRARAASQYAPAKADRERAAADARRLESKIRELAVGLDPDCDHDAHDPVPYTSEDGPLGHGWLCGGCGGVLQVG
jgi:hypothetical protein